MPPYSSSNITPKRSFSRNSLDHVPRKLGGLVDLGRPRRDLLARDRPDHLTNLALFVGKRIEGAHSGVKSSPAAADIDPVIIPVRILALVVAATALACAAMTLLLVAARS